MKKIIILNGAGKKNGNTATLIKAFTESAKANGNEVKEFYLQSMNIKGCLDCQGCARKPSGDNHPCVQNDDMQHIYDAYIACDIVVFATPVYWFTVSGQLKTAVDRLYALQRNHGFEACKKDTVFIMTSGAPADMNPLTISWYQSFEKMGWKSLGMILNDIDEAKRIGLYIQ